MHNTKKVGGDKSKNRSASSKNGAAPKSSSVEKVLSQSEKKHGKNLIT